MQIRVIVPIFTALLVAVFAVSAAMKPTIWQPFRFQPGTNYSYEIIDHTQKIKGAFNLQIQQQGDGLLSATWKSRSENGPEYQSAVVEAPERLVELSRPALIQWPLMGGINATVLSQWWEGFTGLNWQIGATTTIGPVDVAPIAAKITETCALNSFKGFKAELSYGSQSLGELCVATELALPLWAKTYDPNGQLRYEAYLLSYQTPVQITGNQKISKTTLDEAKKLVPFEISQFSKQPSIQRNSNFLLWTN